MNCDVISMTLFGYSDSGQMFPNTLYFRSRFNMNIVKVVYAYCWHHLQRMWESVYPGNICSGDCK